MGDCQKLLLVAGTGVVITYQSALTDAVANIRVAEEVSYVGGKEKKFRRLNGDQTHQGRHIRIPVGEWGIQKVSMYRSGRGIAEK